MARVRVQSYPKKSGPPGWCVWFKDPEAGGKWRRRVLHNCGSKDEAIAAAAELERKLFRRTWYPEDEREAEETFKVACARRLTLAKGRPSEAQDRGRLKVIEDYFGSDRQLASVKVEDVAAFRDHISSKRTKMGEPPAPATIRHYQILLRHVYSLSVKSGILRFDPTKAVPLVRVQNERDRLCSQDELTLIRTEAPDWLRTIAVIAHETGMRLGEIVELDWSRVRLGGPQPSARLKETKTGRPRTVPLTSAAVEALTDWAAPKTKGPIFSTTTSSVSPAWKRLMRKLEIDDLRLHDMRHTWATRHWLTHQDMVRLMREGGWKTPLQLSRYVNLTSADEAYASSLVCLPLGAPLPPIGGG